MIDIGAFILTHPFDVQLSSETVHAHRAGHYSSDRSQSARYQGIHPSLLPLSEKTHEITPVGIMGAGVGGLYAAMILQSLGIPCEILEASERVGGRVFTYRFSSQKHDYFDAGAMRFPDEPIMKRLFHLFRCHQLNSNGLDVASRLIKQYSKADEENTFLDFNGYRTRLSQVEVDSFGFLATGVPKQDLERGVDDILRGALGVSVDAVKKAMSSRGGDDRALKELIKLDKHSLRTYLSLEHGLSTPTINWCETLTAETHWYDHSLSEMVLHAIAFGGPETRWYCLDGGSDVLPKAMARFLEKSSPGTLQTGKVVNAIHAVQFKRIEILVEGEAEPRRYGHVISTIPLPVLRTLDIDEAGFSSSQRIALRQVSYAPSVKIGVKFKSQWWKSWVGKDGKKLNITGGQSYTDRMIRTVVYPSYGLDEPDLTTVLIASYLWESDATFLGSLINSGVESNALLKKIVLRDLARVHDIPLSMLEGEYLDHFGFNWQDDPFAQGKPPLLSRFPAFFRPGEFESLYSSLISPAADGHLHLAGDTMSLEHGWIVGALKASWRAVRSIVGTSYPDLLPDFFEKWGDNLEGTSLLCD
ncbi:hypothetical protein M407DRAFT_64242 [Tulasnella calospora MUT 4182]|uniref:Amine oxidase domain-containing protein n=1 Tax=Tulasnella calospora MUT 4182 TaxID=1051891 RepID=A0A0C3QMX7_9AGAM|nr:hypothetical protein M407DRAFT_64242 [Tulasnella calospora MUT 4182]